MKQFIRYMSLILPGSQAKKRTWCLNYWVSLDDIQGEIVKGIIEIHISHVKLENQKTI